MSLDATDHTLRLHVAEADAVFGRDWVCVGHVAMLANVGDFVTIDLIGNLLVAVRAQDRIRVLSRVCLHRWASVVEGVGNARRFTCPFHAWTYALDGRLIAAAFMDQVEDFDRSTCRLPEMRTDIAEESGLIFINMSADSTSAPPPRLEAELTHAATAGPLHQEVVPLGWQAVLTETAASSEARVLAPNALVLTKSTSVELKILYPNGPDETLVCTVQLLQSGL